VRAAIAVVAVALGAVVIALALGLSERGHHVTGGNSLQPSQYVAILGPGKQLCQDGEVMPAGSGSVELVAGTFGRPGPPLGVTVGQTRRGDSPGGYGDGFVRVPFGGPPPLATPANTRVCVRNRGRTRAAIAGRRSHPGTAATVAGKPADGRITLRWRAAKEASWWADAGAVAARVTRGKADLGPWTPALLLALVWAGALTLVLRSARV
jgi:hypothetical protein